MLSFLALMSIPTHAELNLCCASNVANLTLEQTSASDQASIRVRLSLRK